MGQLRDAWSEKRTVEDIKFIKTVVKRSNEAEKSDIIYGHV